MPYAFDKLDCRRTSKIPQLQNLRQNGRFQVSLLQMSLELGNGNKTLTQIPELKMVFMNIRLTFGGMPCPSFWCSMLEIMCNLTTAILHNNDWNPLTLFGRNQHLVPPARTLDNSIPFGEGWELIVDIILDPRGTNNIY
jgi:hypothetical protein